MAAIEAKATKGIPVLFIGSVIMPDYPDGAQVLKAAADFTCHLSIPHMPQVPQLETGQPVNHFEMNHEFLQRLPLIDIVDGHQVYNLVVEADPGGNEHGCIKAFFPDDEEKLEELKSDVTQLLAAVDHDIGSQETVDAALRKLSQDFPEIAFQPPTLNWMITELINRSKRNELGGEEPLYIKVQGSGFINTAMEMYTRTNTGDLTKGRLVENNLDMMDLHAGMLLARSMLWTKSVKEILQTETKRPITIIFSFDEPCFENMDQPGGPLLTTALYAYQKVWSRHELLPYEPMMHVCGSFISEMLPYVKHLNFDVWNKMSLIIGKGKLIKEFMERGGKLVAGIIPTAPKDVQNFIHQLEQVQPFAVIHFLEYLYREAVVRLHKFIALLQQEGIPEELIAQGIEISLQCGLGGLVKEPREHGVAYTEEAYKMNARLATEPLFTSNT